MNSKKPARTRESPNAIVAMTTGERNAFLRKSDILRAAKTPIAVAPSHTPNAFAATSPISPQSMPSAPAAPPRAFAAIMPLPIARTISPSTSSITAPAMMVVPSSLSIFLRSERIRAVMPTDVAVDMMPM